MGTDYSVYVLSEKEKYSFLAGGYLCTFTVLYLFYHSLPFSMLGGIITFLFLGRYSSRKAEKRRILLITQFKDLLYSLSSYAAANIQMAEALNGCLDSLLLLYDKESPLVRELSYMVRSISENKESEIRLLRDFADRSCCEDIENFVQVYASCIKTGGDIEKVLKSTISIITDKITIEREIRTITSQKRFEGNIITAMPFIVILFLNVFSPEYLEPLYSSMQGRLIMTAALAGILLSHWMIQRITAIEV